MFRNLARGAPAIVMYIGKALFPFNLSIIPTIEDTNMIYGITAIVVIISGLALSKKFLDEKIFFGIKRLHATDGYCYEPFAYETSRKAVDIFFEKAFI